MTPLVNEAEAYVKELFHNKLPDGYTYHSINHIEEVVEAAQIIGKNTGLDESDLEMVLLAAWFHDAGIVEQYEEHETAGIRICTQFLQGKNYPPEKIKIINSAINSTKMPQNPSNTIEKVLCDADMVHAGRKGFNSRSQLLRSEWESVLGKKYSDREWYETTARFLSGIAFHTEYAKTMFEDQKQKNLKKINKKIQDELTAQVTFEDKNGLGEDEAKLKKDKEAARGIETMFRNTMRTHVEFSGMADNKANIMISINTLLLTAIIAILIRKLDANPHLIIPTAILTFFSLVTLIFATLVTRPKITSGIFTKEDIEQKRANLLFFGNFFNMNLKDFEWGMKSMMSDRDFLYGSMIKDFYYLGQVLGKKYKYLRICYTIFMYGLIISIISFAIAVILHPGMTELGTIIE